MSHVRMRVMVEVNGISPIGNNWTLAEAFNQGAKEGCQKLEAALRSVGGKIIGEPEMLTVIYSDKDGKL
jgi:hypothetical protein